MADKSIQQEEQPVCKHHQKGYFKHGNQCHQYHSNIICKINVCRDKNCKERHPKTCKYFSRNNTCKRGEWCAYAHNVNGHQTHIQYLEDEVKNLKEIVENLTNHVKLMNQHNKKEMLLMQEQNLYLSNNMSEMIAKVMAIDLECPENQVDQLQTISKIVKKLVQRTKNNLNVNSVVSIVNQKLH